MALRFVPRCSSMSREAVPRKLEPRSWVCCRKRGFGVRASSVQRPKAVSLQTGVPANILAPEHVQSLDQEEYDHILDAKNTDQSILSIIVVGASGNLARKKIFPALFALYYEDRLPKNFTVFGYGRSVMTNEELRNMITKTLTCRIDKSTNCEEKMDQFLSKCFYQSGQYSSEEHFSELNNKLIEKEGRRISNRLFYLAIPPHMFVDVARCGARRASSDHGWTRVIVEKPFGRDSDSSAELTRELKKYMTEDQIFRIDHHLGEELVENLLVLRFSNLVFEPLWSRNYISNVQLIFSEDFGIQDQGRHFDDYGIIRDVMQNHLLQTLALFAMETPVSLEAEDIRNEKVKVLRSMTPVRLRDAVIGQYKGYCEDPSVSNESITPTFAAATVFIKNSRWDGVPFFMIAGKALRSKWAEIRVQFKNVPGNLFSKKYGRNLDEATNELVIRVHPDEAIYLKINNKVPGLGMRLDRNDLNLLYKTKYPKETPDAYERLLMDSVEGERRLFIRSDELEAAWAVFTPLLKELESRKIAPELYACGGAGPDGVHYLAARHNVRWREFESDDL